MSESLNKCVWMWAGLLTYRLCDRDYECTGCPVEKLFHPPAAEPLAARTQEAPARCEAPAMEVAPDRFHDAQHLWLRVLPNERAQVGLDPMAARLLNRASEIKLPPVGVRVRKGDPVLAVRMKQGEVRFQSPVSGIIERVHRVAHSRIGSVLSRPYSRAWMLVMRTPRLDQRLQDLLVGRDARQRLSRDWSRFREESLRLAGAELSSHPVMPDGGELNLDQLEQIGSTPYFTLLCRSIGDGRANDLGPGRHSGGGRGYVTGRTGGSSAEGKA
jgi:glycine cleavage system H lipoate-binding protein